MIAEVIVDITSGETDRVFDYLCDDSTKVGARVLAPFGPRMLTGFVVSLKKTTDFDPNKLKKIKINKVKNIYIFKFTFKSFLSKNDIDKKI